MENLLIVALIALAGYAAYRAYQTSQAESKEARTVKSLPPSCQHVVIQMDTATQAAFFNEYERKRLKTSVAYIFWIMCGAHYLYLRKLPIQIAFWITGGGLGLWWIYNLFFMKAQVDQANEQVARECLQTLHMGAAFSQLSGATPTDRLVQGRVVTPPPPALLPSVSETQQAQGQWSADPHGRHEMRYFDGERWTEHVMDGAEASVDHV